ncbi:RanGTP-binding protein-domain-containing protein [Fennellomyces sp. T-0311]|nr:RanGTP-binding protein-domain-containing protein [Fennellomyces sp. T-0311]
MSLEDLFGKLALTTVNTVSRIAISHATNAAIRGVTGYITQQPKGQRENQELEALQRQFDLKIKNLKPTIDIIARNVADGNKDLEPALELCNDLKKDIDTFAEEMKDSKSNTNDYVKKRLKTLLASVDDSVPSLHLALRSIESPSRQKAAPSKLLQASAILQGTRPRVFRLRLYSLFAANVRHEAAGFTWKEQLAKCSLEYKEKKLKITEDLDDGRYHEEGESPDELAIDIANVNKMYYTQSGALLNIEDAKTPVLVLKVMKTDKTGSVQVKETEPEIEESELKQADWYAVGLWTSDGDEDEEDEDEERAKKALVDQPSLLLLEAVIKLALLEISEQMDHLDASDDLIDLYMAE